MIETVKVDENFRETLSEHDEEILLRYQRAVVRYDGAVLLNCMETEEADLLNAIGALATFERPDLKALVGEAYEEVTSNADRLGYHPIEPRHQHARATLLEISRKVKNLFPNISWLTH